VSLGPSARPRAYAAALAGAGLRARPLSSRRHPGLGELGGRPRADVGAGSDRGLGLHLLRRRGAAVETFFGSGPDVGPAAAPRLRADLLPARVPAPVRVSTLSVSRGA